MFVSPSHLGPKKAQKAVVAVLAFAFCSGCLFTTASQGRKMRQEIDALKAEQKKLRTKLEKQKKKLTDMISAAKKDVKQIRKVLDEAKKLLERNSADLGLKLEKTRREVERLRGRLEENRFRLKKMEQQLRRLEEDMDIRFSSGDALSKKLPERAEDLYQYARARYDEKKYRLARRALETYLASFSDGDEVDDVHYLLGEIYFAQKQWVSAVFRYRKVLENHEDSERFVPATFKIGKCFMELGRCKDAKPFFETILDEHANSDYASKARQLIQEIEGGRCD